MNETVPTPSFGKIGIEDIERLVVYHIEWIERIAATNGMKIEPKLLIPPVDWLRDGYQGGDLTSLPDKVRAKASRIAEMTWQLASQDILMPDFLNAACLFFIVCDCEQIMEGDEFRDAARDRQASLENFTIVARAILSMVRGRMIQAYVKSKYNRAVYEGSKEWHATNEEINRRFDRAYTAWGQLRRDARARRAEPAAEM